MNTKNTETVRISTLSVGDVVWSHGMRIELDREPILFGDGGVSFDGLVTNIDDVDDPWIVTMSRAWDNNGDFTGAHRWTVQSNDLVWWQRETPAYVVRVGDDGKLRKVTAAGVRDRSNPGR